MDRMQKMQDRGSGAGAIRGGSLRVPAGQASSKDLKRSQTVPAPTTKRDPSSPARILRVINPDPPSPPPPMPPPAPPAPLTCIACLDALPPSDTHIRAPCGHTYDIPCLLSLISTACEHEGLFPPSCCGAPLPEDLFRAHMPEGLGTRFHMRRRELAVPPPRRVYCARAYCSLYLGRRVLSDSSGCGTGSGAGIGARAGQGEKEGYDCRRCGATTCVRCAGERTRGVLHACHADRAEKEAQKLVESGAGRRAGWVACRRCLRVVEPERLACAYAMCACGARVCVWCGAVWKGMDGEGKAGCACKEEREERERKERKRRFGEISAPVLLDPSEVPHSAKLLPVAVAQAILQPTSPPAQTTTTPVKKAQAGSRAITARDIVVPRPPLSPPPLSLQFPLPPPLPIIPAAAPRAHSPPSEPPVLPPVPRVGRMRQTWILGQPSPASPAAVASSPASPTSPNHRMDVFNLAVPANPNQELSPSGRRHHASAPAGLQTPTSESLLAGEFAQERRRRTIQGVGTLHQPPSPPQNLQTQPHSHQQPQTQRAFQPEGPPSSSLSLRYRYPVLAAAAASKLDEPTFTQYDLRAALMPGEQRKQGVRFDQLMEMIVHRPCPHDWRLHAGPFDCAQCQRTLAVHFVSFLVIFTSYMD
ncbi:hypothetical protein EIP86_006207 [Pleurotus ostreatoroseus]|nr:hypothetical protein EIP86_006207 [Pleurotus ostreatoroseus]